MRKNEAIATTRWLSSVMRVVRDADTSNFDRLVRSGGVPLSSGIVSPGDPVVAVQVRTVRSLQVFLGANPDRSQDSIRLQGLLEGVLRDDRLKSLRDDRIAQLLERP